MIRLRRFLRTDPEDAGCEQTMERLHVYVEQILAGAEPDPGIAAHLQACDPCAQDAEGLLAAIRETMNAHPR
jgi:hypothetical protein